MTMRTAALLAAALLAATAAHATAAPASCQLLKDDAGDGTVGGFGPNRDTFDIRSADVATGPRQLVVVLRLASVAADPAPATYEVSWRAGSLSQAMTLHRYAGGQEVASFDPGNGAAQQVSAKVHPPTNSITWTVPRTLSPALGKRGTRFTAFAAGAHPDANVMLPSATPVRGSSSAHFADGDTATSTRSYTDRAPSCVKAA